MASVYAGEYSVFMKDSILWHHIWQLITPRSETKLCSHLYNALSMSQIFDVGSLSLFNSSANILCRRKGGYFRAVIRISEKEIK